MKALAAAVSFLTVIGRGRRPDARATAWFGVVGAGIGLALGAAWEGVGEVWSPGLAAALIVALDLVLTGALHVDGLADSGDGLLPHADRSRRLEIMRSPDVGAFGVAVVVVTLLVRFVALAGLEADLWILVAPWAAARATAALTLRVAPYTRGDGLASSFLDGSSRALLVADVAVIAVAAVIAGVVDGAVGVAAIAVGVAAFGAVVLLGVRRLGGFTGDILGAGIVVSETAALVTLAGSW